MKWLVGVFLLAVMLMGVSAAALEVSCENEAGSCTVAETWSECSCLSGMGSGSSSASSGGSAGDGDMPEPDPPTEDELLKECQDMLVRDCGETVPDPNDVCTPEGLETCTAFVQARELIEENCYEEDVAVSTSSGTDTAVDETPPDGDSAGESDEDELQISAVGEDDVVPVEPNPWMISDCCEEMLEEPEEKAMVECVIAAEDGDCEAYIECIGDVGGDFELVTSRDEAENADDKGESDGTAGSTDDSTAQGVGAADAEGENEEATSDDEGDDDSGCSAVPSRKSASYSLFSLMAMVLK